MACASARGWSFETASRSRTSRCAHRAVSIGRTLTRPLSGRRFMSPPVISFKTGRIVFAAVVLIAVQRAVEQGVHGRNGRLREAL
jgi:hypothetical protein